MRDPERLARRPVTGAPFVHRETYRQRRLLDAAKLLPVLGAVLVSVPLMWRRSSMTTAETQLAEPSATVSTSGAMIYLFLVWLLLALLASLISYRISREGPSLQAGSPPDREEET